MSSQILVIAGMTHRSNVRNRILTSLFGFAAGLTGAMVFFPSLIPGADERAAVDTSFALMEVLGFTAVLFSLSIFFFREIEGKTCVLDLTKPVSRWQYLAGRYFGAVRTLAWLTFYMFSIFFLFAMVSRGGFSPYYAATAVYLFLEFTLLAAVAILFAVFTTSLPASVLFTLGVFVLGHGSPYLKAFSERAESPLLRMCLRVLYVALPNLDFYNLKDKMDEAHYFVSPAYFGLSLGYTVVYVVLALSLAYLAFRRRDL